MRPFIAFACAHLTDERLYAAQVAALEPGYECRVFAFRDHATLGAMADELLASAPARFTLAGLSLGGYLSMEILRHAPHRIERLVLMDTTASADTPARRAGRDADIAKVREGGIEALIPELAPRWMHPEHAARPDLSALMAAMARSIGAQGQLNQQHAMMARPDSHDDLARVGAPTLVLCGRQDPVTPLPDHVAIAERVRGSRLAVIERCGHLSTIEQPDAVNGVLLDWLRQAHA